MNKPIESNASGTTGVVYAGSHCMDIRDYGSDEGEGRTGWKQIDSNKRRKVRRIRTGHTMCDWEEIDQDPSADHRKYPLF